MRKFVVAAMVMVLTLVMVASVAMAEHDDLGGVGVAAVRPGVSPLENGSILPPFTVRPQEHGDIGGPGVTENRPILPYSAAR